MTVGGIFGKQWKWIRGVTDHPLNAPIEMQLPGFLINFLTRHRGVPQQIEHTHTNTHRETQIGPSRAAWERFAGCTLTDGFCMWVAMLVMFMPIAGIWVL